MAKAVPELPSWFLNRPKQGFHFPFQLWLDDPASPLPLRLPSTPPALDLRPWYRRWALMVWQHWLQEHLQLSLEARAPPECQGDVSGSLPLLHAGGLEPRPLCPSAHPLVLSGIPSAVVVLAARIWLAGRSAAPFWYQTGTPWRLKPGLRVKFPWRFRCGNQCWFGADVWIDNLAPVSLGDRACLSQGA